MYQSSMNMNAILLPMQDLVPPGYWDFEAVQILTEVLSGPLSRK
jgi:hypothetical protein